MSYILDALKKLEHEKSRKDRSTGMINITGALFENEQPRSPVTAAWKIALTVVVAVVITFGATWYLLQPGKGRGKAAPRTAVPPPAAQAVRIDTPPAAPAPVSVPVLQAAPAAPAVTVTTAAAVAPTKVVPVRQPAPVAKAPIVVQAESAKDDAAALLTLKELHNRKKDRRGQALTADQIVAAPADIKLSGIAWQDERLARRAVVNGFLMKEGGVVSGAKITEILQDRVRFSLSGKMFDIPLVSSSAPAAGK
ncbi:MAG: hypothetical protein JJE30_01460 [Desulfuromonadales bacterium]|nr:hypothetical protein [Desulfuromonadales bacterium]